MHKNKYIQSLVLAFALGSSSLGAAGVYALDSAVPPGSVHAGVTREALSATLAEPNLKAVIAGNDSQDMPGGEGVGEKRRHFEGEVFPAALAYINREKTRALNLAGEADSDVQSRADTLRHLGLLLHSVQDFYLHTNYVELQLEEQKNKSDPYNIPLVDWVQVPEGYVGSRTGNKLAACSSLDAGDRLNKAGATAAGGKIIVHGGLTQYSIARDLCVRETQRQWKLFETLVRNRCGSRASAVLAGLEKGDPLPKAGSAADKDKD